MGQQSVWHDLAIATHGVERAAEINGIPQRYGGCDQGEPARAVLQRFDGPVAQLAEAMEADSTRKGIPGFALVEFRCCLSPELWLFQPVQGVKARSIRPISRSACASPFCRG
jgi:hypothetical protein